MKVFSSEGQWSVCFQMRENLINKYQQYTTTSVEIPLQDLRWEKRNFFSQKKKKLSTFKL